MKRLILTLSTLFIIIILEAQPVKVMLVTGGHSFDTIQFLQLFNDLKGVEYKHFEQPVANKTVGAGLAGYFDVLVFYDMWQPISEEEKKAYIELTKKGKSFLFLHHSLVSYQNWSEFEKIVGGKYIEKGPGIPETEQSTYEHDVWVHIQAVQNHPVTRGFDGLRFFDEVYGNFRVSDGVIPLITTNHPKSNEIIGWENRYNSSKIIYLQPGHDYRTFESEDFKKLLLQTINYLAAAN